MIAETSEMLTEQAAAGIDLSLFQRAYQWYQTFHYSDIKFISGAGQIFARRVLE
ncbi:MAG TPA: hypothetical protein GXX29_12555 [Firmicutes bacterium]|nr:hypothetical protein [Bacillota bacterium]